MVDRMQEKDIHHEGVSTAIHVPVMTQEIIEHLSLRSGACIVDCTLGTAGHALDILKIIGPQGIYVGIDRDGNSLKIAQERLKDYSHQCRFCHSDFRNLDLVLENCGIREIDGMLLDLGISSFQLEDPQRGFSLKSEGPLDMRMDQDSYISAYDLVNSLSEKEISNILKNFGEERWHNRIAHYLVRERQKCPIESTKALNDAVIKAIPYQYQDQKIHPATRTFQAFRIAVNRELEALEIVLEKCMTFLRKGSRLCVISFHSLEDRIVKNKLREFSKMDQLKLIVKKPLRPTDQETRVNPRARSARLRVAERI